ncbi:MAG: RiPP maturation radical SAM C-methyltransferase [Euryarchaeota archaeon]|nr:RiPP maturation radical SAM C-methyltransferase [Euryarchaeota archaeon]
MHDEKKSVLLVAMPFAGITIPSIQLPVLEGYCRERGIPIASRHLYLKAAELYGLQNYHYLIYPPNDSYTAQMVFSRYVFPEHWKNNEDRFREFFNRHSVQNSYLPQFSFDEYVHRTDVLYQWILDHVDWRSYDIIGFTLNYGQLLPSLAIAKKIKELVPEKKIVFGGSRTVDTLGMNVLRAFEYVDFIVSGDGEDALFLLASDYENYKSIPRLMYRMGNEVLWNKSDVVVDLNAVPIPSYDQFYQELASTSVDVQQFFQYYGRLPVEISRGCWWNRCTFCNLNIQHQCYREKSVDRIIQEIQFLSERYHMMDFQLIGNTLPKTEYRTLFEKLKHLGRDFSFFVEARAGRLTSDDYTLMKEAGFTMIQTGIESFSRNYLRKMNKGVRVIDNIAVLKFCKENGIKNNYNLMVRYPNEEHVDFNETKKIVQLLKGYLDTPQLCELRVMHGSLIQRHPEQFNIERLEHAPIDLIMYPLEFLEKGFSFVYDFNRKIPSTDHPWESLVEEWKKEREVFELETITRQTTIDRLVFYFVDGGSFIKIYDKRDRQNIRIFVLNELERAMFLACVDVVSLQQLQQMFTNVPEFELIAMLQSFEQNGLVFVEDELFLCLPLRISVGELPKIRTECQVNVTA